MKNKLSIYGASSTLSKKLRQEGFNLIEHGRTAERRVDFSNLDEVRQFSIPIRVRGHIINLGCIFPRGVLEQSNEEIYTSIVVNLISPVMLIERIFTVDPKALVIAIGSESAEKGSFDTSYFLAKAALRKYILEKGVPAGGRLVQISPSTIEDSNMTQSRIDVERLSDYRKQHPQKRFLRMEEVVEIIVKIIEIKTPYFTNIDIPLNGGKFSRMR